MGFTLIMVEKDARRAVQLTYHHPFRAIDDKGTIFGHQRYGAEIDLLFLDIANVLDATLFLHIVDHQAHSDLEWGLVGHPSLQTLFDIVLDPTNGIADEFQGRRSTEVANREDSFEYALETFVDAFIGIHLFLQKPFIGLSLHLYQVGDLDYLLDLAKILPHTILIGQ